MGIRPLTENILLSANLPFYIFVSRFMESLKMSGPRATDEEVARQILGLFAAHRIGLGGILRRFDLFEVRDGDFRRGMDYAVACKWVEQHRSDRHRYVLTHAGYGEVNSRAMTGDAG